MSVQKMSLWLRIYSDREAAELLHSGFSEGFFIPYVLSRSPVFANNLKSARDNPRVLRDKVFKDSKIGHSVGFPAPAGSPGMLPSHGLSGRRGIFLRCPFADWMLHNILFF